MRDEERVLNAWVASIPGIGPSRFAKLTSLLPELSLLLTASSKELVQLGLTERLAQTVVTQRILHPPQQISDYCQSHAIRILDRKDHDYPKLLQEIADPPVVLYVKGQLPEAKFPKIAVVGTRFVTEYGREVTQVFTGDLVRLGFVIVSGFMYGVDACAHERAIEMQGQTIGVLGFGFEFMYPRQHEKLAQLMLDSGNCLVSEFPFWQSPIPQNFPIRNRIVSGMSLAVLVTEASSKSGSKITAGLAVDQGREVFAIPGPIDSPFSEGTKELINLGAKLVTKVPDILVELT